MENNYNTLILSYFFVNIKKEFLLLNTKCVCIVAIQSNRCLNEKMAGVKEKEENRFNNEAGSFGNMCSQLTRKYEYRAGTVVALRK